MKFTEVLHKQHLGRAMRSLWQHHRERPVIITKAEQILTSMGFTVQDAVQIIQPKQERTKIDLTEIFGSNVDPDWKKESCLTYKDHNLLQEGVPQACLLTKTVQIDNEMPEKIKNLETDISERVDNLVKRIVYSSTIYDAQQVVLPKLKDPDRPSWIFPRAYGITSTKKVYNLSRKFLQLCESLVGLRTAQNRSVVHDGVMSMCIDKEMERLQFELKMDLLMTSLKPLTPIADANAFNELDMPSIYPLHHTIGLTQTNTYKTEDIYPINANSALMNVHTIFLNYDPEEVKNLTELPTTESQIHARAMIKAFTAAVAYARQKFGLNVKELPEPVVVQCIQSDGQTFHFSVYQLNTLMLDGTQGIRNFWWSTPSIKLYDMAQYECGKPTLKGYNNDVFRRFLAFYKNE
ncbi:mitochondrial ribosomal protein L37 [Calliopsis andreniformis]|uniref:mitochondrial ribosomal protein L37 n=1 Tax=Calliopsis andreniformis TaxID=337506 RepID=UPI003FCDDCEC